MLFVQYFVTFEILSRFETYFEILIQKNHDLDSLILFMGAIQK